jgi:hypothetical protein
MTSRADQNDDWASYAGPGGWNGEACCSLTISQQPNCFFSLDKLWHQTFCFLICD